MKAQENFRELVIHELDNMLNDAKKGEKIRRHVNMTPPSDHTSDYDKLIGLLNMCSDTEVQLNVTEFDNYINDNWSWSQQANITNSTYSGDRNISPTFVAEDTGFPGSY